MVCSVTVVFVRIGLWVTKYQRIRALLVKPCPPDADPEKIKTVARIVRTVAKVSRFFPDASCLTRSISCQSILSWKGIPTTIHIGARTDETGAFKAHAWLLWNGQIVLDGDDETSQTFKKILDLPTPALTPPAA